MTLFFLLIFLLWMILWSFSSVVIHRLRTWEKWIFFWRSKCPNCQTILQAKDLVPLFSYLFTQGKCRYCHKKVSLYYPSLELVLWIFFVLIAYFLVDVSALVNAQFSQMLLLDFWFFVWFFVFIYTVYDILYLEIPEIILTILIVWIIAFLGVHSLFPHLYNISTLPDSTWWFGWQNILSMSFTIVSIGLLYVIMLFWFKEKYDLLIFFWIVWSLLWIKYFFGITLSDFPLYSSLIGVLAIFWFFFFQILISKWKWMWAWDLRIAIVLGLLLWSSYWHVGLMITYTVWSIIGLGILFYAKIIKKEKNFNGQIPFWPFLTVGLFMTLFFQEEIDVFLKNYFLL